MMTQHSLFFSRAQILEMEIAILTALDYKIMVPTAHHFLLRFLKAAHADKELVRISCWVMDGTLLSTKLMRYLPSEIAAACVLIARHSIGRHGWSPTLLKYAKYKEEEVAPIARVILAEYSSFAKIHPTLRGIKDKYESARFAAIAKTAVLKHDF